MVCATLQELSGGRFLLGLAAGAADVLGWAGIDPRRAAAPHRRGGGGDPGAVRGRRARRHPGSGGRAGNRTGDCASRPVRRRSTSARCRPACTTRRELADGGAPPAVPAGVVRRGDGEHRRGRAPRPAATSTTSTWRRASGCRSATTRPGRSTPGRQARLLRRRRSRRPSSTASAWRPPTWPRCGRSIRTTRRAPLPPAMMSLGISGTPDEVVAALPRPDRRRGPPRVVRSAARRRSPAGRPPARRARHPRPPWRGRRERALVCPAWRTAAW